MRCPNGTRKNKNGDCVPKGQKKRCPNGTRKNKNGDCVAKVQTPYHSAQSSPAQPQPEIQKAMTRIQSFMRRTTQKRRALFLKNICSEAGLCIAFGIESLKIKDFFRNFHFDLVDNVKRIGVPSTNGFVTELRYAKRGYNAYAVLKSSAAADKDNLMYEYRVGLFLNKMSFFFPCFLETYGLFQYNDEAAWRHMKTTQQTLPSVFSTLLKPQPYDLSVGCEKSKHMAVLIQHIRGCQTVKSMLTRNTVHHILPILFQVYYPLFHMRSVFTHYDLHDENVILYEPVPGKYIQYHYETDNGVISFRSPYIAKIIDYGRSYIDDGETSKDIYKKVCKLPKCKPCEDYGFGSFPLSNKRDFYHIVSQKKNESHDLRFLNIVLRTLRSFALPVWLKLYLDKFNVVYKETYGTPEHFCKRKTCSVTEAYQLLERVVPLANVQMDMYHTDKYGDLYIYKDKPMEFRKI
jgi:hypothetical protein